MHVPHRIISNTDLQAIVDCLSILVQYMKDDPHHSPAIRAHTEALEKRLNELMK